MISSLFGAGLLGAMRPLLGLQLFKIVVEAAEARLPELAVVSDPFGDRLQPLRLQAAGPALRLARARDQTGALEHLEMLGDRRLAHGERPGEIGHPRLAG